MKKTLKKAKSKVISKKRASKKPVVMTFGVGVDEESLKTKLGANFGKLEATRLKNNPFKATSADEKNIAYGQSRAEALHNLLTGIANRTL